VGWRGRGPDFPIIVEFQHCPNYAVESAIGSGGKPQQIIAPTLDPLKSSALLSALSTTYVDQSFPDGVFNFERSTFRVLKNQNGPMRHGTISVNRVAATPPRVFPCNTSLTGPVIWRQTMAASMRLVL